MTSRTIRIATRTSSLALWQARHVSELLRSRNPDLDVELIHVSTQGDRDRSEPLRQFGGLGVFTREVQSAVLADEADLAVHSLKDLPTAPVDGLHLAAVPGRAAVYDALVFPAGAKGASIDDLPESARVGTGSPRRQAQFRHARPDLRLLEIRGNVETRLRKLDDGDYDAIVLAEAGLSRLGLAERISGRLEPPLMYPAVAQGALGIECRTSDDEVRTLLAEITHPQTQACTTAERTLLAELRAGCHAPLGALSTVDAETLTLAAVILSPDGAERIEASTDGPLTDAANVGRTLASKLRNLGADELLQVGSDA